MINPHTIPTRPQASTGVLERCFHCEAVIQHGRGITASIDGRERNFCCHGCLSVARLTRQSQDADASMATASSAEAILDISGMTCASCARAIELGLQNLDGVIESRVDVITRRLHVRWQAATRDLESIRATIRKLGYGVSMAVSDDQTGPLARRQERRRQQRLLLAWLAMMQIMMLSVPVYLAGAGDISPDIAQLLRVAQLALALPVMLFSAWPIYQAAWRDVRAGRIGMDVPVTLGLGVAVGASLVAVAHAEGEVYFDSMAMFVALLLGSRWLQERGLKRASEYLGRLVQNHRPQARKIIHPDQTGAIEMIDAALLTAGDLIQVRPGEDFPADGIVIRGASACSEALLTGESKPVAKQPGDLVLASSSNLEQALVVRVTHAGSQTALAALTRLTEAASRFKPALVQFSDQAARWFMVLIGIVVIAAALIWSQIDPARIIPVTIAILIITCPCALSLAVPMALAAAQASLARQGILVTRSAAIETMGKIDHVAFDKTGTLTEGRMQLIDLVPLRRLPDKLRQALHADEMHERSLLLRIAVALEQDSNHPVASALHAAHAALSPHPPSLPAVEDAVLHSGAGVEGRIAHHCLRLGKIDFALAQTPATPNMKMDWAKALATHLVDPDCSISLLADGDGPLALFVLADPVRADALDVIEYLKRKKISISILSGDRIEAVASVARQLGIDTMQAACSPTDKRAALTARQQQGEIVAMIGDGLNDAPVIAQADVSVAFAGASTLAQTRADFILLSDHLSGVINIARTSQRGLAVIRQNLVWALLYNLIAIPVAASGIVSPVLASVGMVLSSLLVVGNSLRLLPRLLPHSSPAK